jgi:prefoldin subunit 5
MSSFRAQLAWIVRGRTNTVTTLDALSHDIRALQEKVEAMDQRLRALAREVEVEQATLRERQLDGFDRVRDVVTAATDDLAERIAAVQARLAASG